MMSGINAFITSFCTSCILLGFLYLLCPAGNMSSSVKYIFCLCFVCCVVSNVIAIPKPDFTVFDKNRNIEILTEQNTAVTAQTVFAEALLSENVKFRKITVNTNKLNDGSIIINKVTVYTDEPPQRVIEVIGSNDYEVDVINE